VELFAHNDVSNDEDSSVTVGEDGSIGLNGVECCPDNTNLDNYLAQRSGPDQQMVFLVLHHVDYEVLFLWRIGWKFLDRYVEEVTAGSICNDSS
jgi:hypothetical protein